MLDFEEELKKFQPSLEVEDIENAVYQEDLTDMTDCRRRRSGICPARSNPSVKVSSTTRPTSRPGTFWGLCITAGGM